MKISGILAIKNGISGGFPFLEAVLSIMPVVDEFLIVDGGSNDGTWEILNDLREMFPGKVGLFRHDWKVSPSFESIDASFNEMVSQATGDWIFVAEGDEIWHEKDLKNMREFISFADEEKYNAIRSGCIEARWDGVNATYLRGSDYKCIRIFRKQPNLICFRVGDDVFIEPNRVQREGFTSSNLPPELDADFGFYHFHRLFPDNAPNADRLIMEELAIAHEERKIFYQPIHYTASTPHPGLPEIMKGLAFRSSYIVRDELFDVDWLNRVTGLQYSETSIVKGLNKEENEMRLLPNFDLDGFRREVWLNRRAKEKWGSILLEAASLLQDMEVESVVRGQRPCSWQTIGEEDYPRFQREWESKGVKSAVVRKVGQFQGFTNKHYPVREGEPAMVCCILSKSMSDLETFKKAVEEQDDYTQGILLGYPECCCRFFRDVWLKGYHDPIWQAALNSSIVHKESNYMKMRVPGLASPVLRFLGIRIAFHIPCSFNCLKTLDIAKERLKMVEEINPGLAGKIVQLLSMPMSWDCYHGIALIRTPIIYAVVPSCGSVERFVIDFEGDYVPPEAEEGLVYPNNLVKSGRES